MAGSRTLSPWQNIKEDFSWLMPWLQDEDPGYQPAGLEDPASPKLKAPFRLGASRPDGPTGVPHDMGAGLGTLDPMLLPPEGPGVDDDLERQKAKAIAELTKADRTRGGNAYTEYPGEGAGLQDLSARDAAADFLSDEDAAMAMPFDVEEASPRGTRGRTKSGGTAVGSDQIPVTKRGGRRGREVLARGLTPDMEDLLPPSTATAGMGMDSGEGLMPDDDLLPPPGSYKRPPAGRQGDGTGTEGNPSTTGAGVEKAPVDTTPVKENPMNAVQRFAQDTLGWDEDKRSDMSRALITGGLATMAGTSPYAMENIGKGGLMGVDAYYGAKDQRRDESLEDDAIAMQKELHEIKLAEGRRAAEKHGIDMKKMKKLEEAGIDPLDLLTGSAKSKAYAALLYKNGELDEETYKSILGIKDEEEAF